jgi:alpha-tubulin suppressor-like RCC1 family protein
VQLASGGVGGVANAATTCALLDNHDLYCWGSNAYGQLGNGTNDSDVHAQPIKVLGGIKQVAVSPTAGHLCALKASDGSVSCWGSNGVGQAGQFAADDAGARTPGPDPVTTPAPVAGLSGVQSIALGDGTACAVMGGGVQCWGDNSNGQAGTDPGGNTDQCGVPATSCILSPTTVSGLSNVSTVAVGADDSCALTAQGGITCWGVEVEGSTMDALSTSPDGAFHAPTPLLAPFDHGVTQLAMGAAPGKDWGCATVGASLYCWGDDAFGQVGYQPGTVDHVPDPSTGIVSMQSLGTTGGVTVPQAGAFAVSATVCAIGVDLSLWCWGSDGQGEVSGGAGAPDSYVPHQRAPSSDLTL